MRSSHRTPPKIVSLSIGTVSLDSLRTSRSGGTFVISSLLAVMSGVSRAGAWLASGGRSK
ncbi:MAG: hypothetical protein EOO39_24280 [Cytophagaceae bacterium]|nr:MAG: hypothetical protein EOO39_24280 [Cytophagaceae bacterium]